jgi:hypothetical protein
MQHASPKERQAHYLSQDNNSRVICVTGANICMRVQHSFKGQTSH